MEESISPMLKLRLKSSALKTSFRQFTSKIKFTFFLFLLVLISLLCRKEVDDNSMMEWLKTLSYHDFTGVRAQEDWEKQNALVIKIYFLLKINSRCL